MGAHTLLAALIFLCGCADGDMGAVSVRWRIVDLQSFVGYDPRTQGLSDGSCAGPNGEWVVNKLRLTVADPDSGAPVDISPPYSVIFTCRQREATTSFQIPLGRWAFNLCAFSMDPEVCDEGVTPAPTIRIVRKAEIINLDVIEIGVRPPAPNPAPSPADLGGLDASSPP
jgi:hypothetical protein